MYTSIYQVRKSQGFSLLIVVILFMALTVVGLAVMRSGILSEKQAGNFQENSVTFHTAQSTNNAVIRSYNYDKSFLDKAVEAAPAAGDLTTHTNGYTTCIDAKGNMSDCATSVYTDADDGVLFASTETLYRECARALKCLGNSADLTSNNKFACNTFEHKGKGLIDNVEKNAQQDSGETQTEINQWTILIAACEARI